jgi:tetratricopeptide (TPR) repeat protein
MAVVLRDRGEAEKALASFRRALDIARGYEEAVEGIGEVLMEVGRHAEELKVLANTFGVIRFEAGAGVSVKYGDRR